MSQELWALISVFNKDGVVEFAQRLVKMGWNILSSGGTAKKLSDAGVSVKDVAELVGGAAILGHRVVTLSRQVHAGLLADALKPEDLAELVFLNIPFIDLVRCDFYPLAEAIADPKATIGSVVEKTDIGGPCMVRSGAKGMRIVICRQEDMEPVLQELESNGTVSYENRQKLRARAEFEVAKYVGDSAMYHGNGQFKVITGERILEFKGENGPQTPATLFSAGANDPLALDKFKVIEGAPPSYNNWCDVDRLLQTMTHLAAAWKLNFGSVPCIAIGCKHGNSCGATVSDLPFPDVRRMVLGDTRAIFGGVIMTNFNIEDSQAITMAEAMPDGKARFDGVIAPAFSTPAIATLSRAKGKCRLMVNPALGIDSALLDKTPRFRYIRGGLLTQPAYTFLLDFNDPEIKVYGTRSQDAEIDLLVAWGVGCTSNSNTITIVKDGMLIGNGVGQQDRVGAAELAIRRAVGAGHGDKLKGAVAYSDSFFPFPDAPDLLIKEGIKAIFSTSGSINDKLTQELCTNNGVTLYQLPDAKARGFFGH
jgi:phosphoribosylaminoimidazolecarboxamide formyltransferase/IMP cyclohydrolase